MFSFKRIILCAKNEPVLNNLTVKKLKKLGEGGQAEVYQVEIQQEPSLLFVDKTRKVKNNPELSKTTLMNLLTEFWVAKDL